MRWLVVAVTSIGWLSACGDNARRFDITLLDSGIDAPPIPPYEPKPPTAYVRTCDPISQAPCAADEKCTFLPGNLYPYQCVPDGELPLGATCTLSSDPEINSGCARGTECSGGVCKSICDPEGVRLTCDAEHACVKARAGVGYCEVVCDPLTQEAAVAPTAACGSPDPARPTRGCYAHDEVTFTCAAVGGSATDREPARGPSPATASWNGCQAGYVPALAESSSSTTVVCVGLCAAAPTDVRQPDKLAGDPAAVAKLPASEAPAAGDGVCSVGKKGSEAGQSCRYAWWFHRNGGAVRDSAFDDRLGLCFATQHYTFDHDGDASTAPIAQPRCDELPSAADPPAGCECDATGCRGAGCPLGVAEQWGCHPRSQAFGFEATPTVARMAYGASPSDRHTLE